MEYALMRSRPTAKRIDGDMKGDPEHADADFKFQGEYASASADALGV